MTSMIVRVGVVATSTNPVTKVPTSAPAVEMPLSRPTTPPVLERSMELQLHDHRRDRAQHDRGEEERGEAEGEGRRADALAGRLAEVPDDGHGAEREDAAERDHRPEEPMGVDAVGDPAAGPRAERDAGEHGADDRRVGLQADADVRREQPPGEDLEHQHRGRADEHDRAGEQRPEPRRSTVGGRARVVHGSGRNRSPSTMTSRPHHSSPVIAAATSASSQRTTTRRSSPVRPSAVA